MYTPYIVPSENGNRSGVSWLQLDGSVVLAGDKEGKSFRKSGSSSSIHIDRDASPSIKQRLKSDIDSDADTDDNSDYISPQNRQNSLLSPSMSKHFQRSAQSEDPENEAAALDGAEVINEVPEVAETAKISLRVVSEKAFNFSAQHFTTEDLQVATHNSELEYFPRPFISLNLDGYLMGVGGDDSWSSCVHEEHLLPPDVYHFDFSLSLLREK